jgi:hypothetical protein
MIRNCFIVVTILCGLSYSEMILNLNKSIEFGGNISFSASSINHGLSDAPSQLYFEPIINYYFSNHFYMGPELYYNRIKYNGYYIEKYYGIGLEFGFLINAKQIFYPFIGLGGCFDFSTYSLRLFAQNQWHSESDIEGFSIPLTFGIKLPISKHLIVNLNSAYIYKIQAGDALNLLLSIGLTGTALP